MKVNGRSMVNKEGFTILEFVIVILVLSILAAVIVPQMSGFYSIKFDGAAHRLMSDMKYAQRLAMSTHQIHGVSFVPGQEEYTVYRGSVATPVDDPLNPGSPLTVDYDDIEQFSGIDLRRANFNGGTEVRFDSLGVPYDASDVPLGSNGRAVLIYQGERIRILVTPRTGMIRIVKG